MILEIFIYIIIGIFSGILTGFLGICGGIIIVPALFFLYNFLVTGLSNPMHSAIGTSLAIITISSLVAMFLYQKRHAIFWPIFKYLNVSLIIGAFLGVLVSNLLSTTILSQLFAFFAFLLGLYFIFLKKIHKRKHPPEKILVIFTGLIISFLATLLGIGGGVIAIPFFIMLLRVPNYTLVGSAATTTFITSIVGTISYLITGINTYNPSSIGYIYLPAFIVIGFVSIFSVPLSIKLADRVQIKLLKKIFGLALIAICIFMFFK